MSDLTLSWTQSFEEDEYYCGSAVAISVVGRKVERRQIGDEGLRLVVEPGKGPFTVLIASAASFDRKKDIVASALSQLDAAAAKGYAALLKSNRNW